MIYNYMVYMKQLNIKFHLSLFVSVTLSRKVIREHIMYPSAKNVYILIINAM